MPIGTKKTVGKDADGGSVTPPPATTKPTGWGDLPNEVLAKIFCELKMEVNEYGLLKSKKEMQAFLNCRLMNHRWKDVINDVLEKQCLKFWTEWRPHVNKQDANGFPHYFAILHVDSAPAGGGTRSPRIHCPPFLKKEMKMLEKSPSPTNAVCVTQKPSGRVAHRSHKNWNLTSVYVFAKFGNHLTAITFSSITNLELQTLHRILNHTPNLQGMTLQRIKMSELRPDMWKFAFPSLPKLAHLKLLEFEWVDYFRNKADLNLRILKAYKQRLETIEIDCWYQDYKVDTESFPMLKQVKIFMDNKDFGTPQLPSVPQLCLKNLQNINLIKELPYLLNKPTSLVQLHIQLIHSHFHFATKVNPAHQFDCPTLPNVKRFAVTYPMGSKRSEAVQRLLKMLPNLDELNFIQFDETGEYGKSIGDRTEAMKNRLLEMSYWTQCKKLKVISVSRNADSSKPFYTRRAPFPK